jgi:hypothetical protein
LEFVQIDVQSAIEAEGRCDRRDDLSDQAVQVLERGAWNIKVTAADIINSLVIDQERAVRVLNGRVRTQDRIIGLHDGSGYAGCGIDCKLELGFLAIVGRKALEQQGPKARASSSSKGVED